MADTPAAGSAGTPLTMDTLVSLCKRAVPTEPIGLAVTPDESTLLVASGWGKALTALDAKTLSPSFAVDLPREPRAVLVDDEGGRAFVSHAALAHHSFALYNMEQTKTFTGVVTRVNPDANHLQIFFAEMNPERKNVIRGEDGKPIIWAVEMTGSAQAAAEGISVGTFAPGTIFSTAMHPLRSGEKAGDTKARYA